MLVWLRVQGVRAAKVNVMAKAYRASKSQMRKAGISIGDQYLLRSDYCNGRYEGSDRYTVMSVVYQAYPEVAVMRHDPTGGTFLVTLSVDTDDTGAIGS